MTALPEQPHRWLDEDEEMSIEELARRQGVKPIEDVSDLAQPGFFESDEEYEEFLADLYAERRRGFE